MAGLYLHIPFCKQACHYCDFHFSTRTADTGAMVDAMVKEIDLRKDYLQGDVLRTIYFGGGTPSLLDVATLRRLMDAIRNSHDVDAGAEVTLEANPDDLASDKLLAMRKAGINRLSIGIQSFDDHVLAYFNRAHNRAAALRCIDDARSAGFDNLSIDLIYGIPGQSTDDWRRNIDTAMGLGPEHVSAYSLTIEEKTVFGKWQSQNKIKPVDESLVAGHLELLMKEMSAHGYDHYEISNFAKPGFHSRHNSSYWSQEKYTGIGPSAHSYNGISRQFNLPNNALYVKSLATGAVPFEQEVLTRENMINEFILTRLRTSQGCDLAVLRARLQYDVREAHGAYVQQLVADGLAVLDNDVLILTNRGKLFADKIALDLFVNAL